MSGYVPLNERRHRAHAKLLEAVGTGNRVLDVGCSSGYLARPLAERGNTIVGIELDPEAARAAEEFCELVLVGDVETMDLPLEPGSFDVVLGGDVIEHLRDPARHAGSPASIAPSRAGGSSSRPRTSPTGRSASRSSLGAGGTPIAGFSTARTRISSRERPSPRPSSARAIASSGSTSRCPSRRFRPPRRRREGHWAPEAPAFRLPVRGRRPNQFVTANP